MKLQNKNATDTVDTDNENQNIYNYIINNK